MGIKRDHHHLLSCVRPGCGVSSAVERYPSKLDVVGSIPILRFPFWEFIPL